MKVTRLTLSAVIPTKNRPDDLRKAVASLRSQTRPPEELIVVDQSPGEESATLVREMYGRDTATRLVYIHDPQVAGLVDAKRVGSTRAAGNIVCFLEDDVILEPEYIAEVERGFLEQPEMFGCSGIITNWPLASGLYVTARGLFLRGIFHDPRVKMFTQSVREANRLIQCDVLSGGLSSWRKEALSQVKFDTRNEFFMFEDMEFSTRVVKALGHCLYINPRARVEHHWSQVNRDVHGARQRRKLAEALVYYRRRRDWSGANSGLLMAMVWWSGEALLRAIAIRSPRPLTGYIQGVLDGVRKPLAQ